MNELARAIQQEIHDGTPPPDPRGDKRVRKRRTKTRKTTHRKEQPR